jgi:CheY-like chemotaxis protein
MGSVPRVLVVEDNTDLAELLSEALAFLGTEVAVAASADDGLKHYRTMRPHLALVDLRLAGTSGLELARAIRTEPSDRRALLVAVTGLRGAQVEQEATDAGFDQVMFKPFDLDRVQALLAEALVFAG